MASVAAFNFLAYRGLEYSDAVSLSAPNTACHVAARTVPSYRGSSIGPCSSSATPISSCSTTTVGTVSHSSMSCTNTIRCPASRSCITSSSS
eukprot:CAMPEP_0176434976 /NCGR_PEP_ID=MMETSP0127-20121128/17022_1 /TAXON_ID=938130 /ORGANISM="Platyophrya macrostoma, Strain WH" /LENGTH=91 /DNA_ID=CAMNT_0017817865 /DNA_START=28 /DNA_END=300 /DNA_ORIENTATION=-